MAQLDPIVESYVGGNFGFIEECTSYSAARELNKKPTFFGIMSKNNPLLFNYIWKRSSEKWSMVPSTYHKILGEYLCKKYEASQLIIIIEEAQIIMFNKFYTYLKKNFNYCLNFKEWQSPLDILHKAEQNALIRHDIFKYDEKVPKGELVVNIDNYIDELKKIRGGLDDKYINDYH